MKFFYIFLLAVATASATAQVNLPVTIDFSEYADGQAIESGKVHGTNANEWLVSCKAEHSNGISPVVKDETLTYPGYRESGNGKILLFDGNLQQTTPDLIRNTIYRFSEKQIPAPGSKNFVEGDNFIYVAAMFNLSDFPDTENANLVSFLKQGSYDKNTNETKGTGTTIRGYVQVKVANGKISFSIRKNITEGEEIKEWSPQFDLNKTVLLVVKYIFMGTNETGDPAQFSLFVNPDPQKNEVENENVRIEALGNDVNQGADLRFICFHQNGLSKYKVGGIRIAKTFEDAVKGDATSAVHPTENDKAICYSYEKDIYVEGLTGQFNIYNLSGKCLQSFSLTSATNRLTTSLSPGMYIVKCVNTDLQTSYVNKIYIR